MQHLKLYEEWNFLQKKGHNIYALLGQNLQNYMTTKQQALVRNRFFDQKFLKQLQSLIADDRANVINVSDVVKLFEDFYKDLLQKVEKLKEVADFRSIFQLHLQFTAFIILAFRFETLQLAKQANNESWFNFYKIKEVKDLKEQDALINQKWLKIAADESKIKGLIVTEFNTALKNWKNLFKDEKVLKLRDLKKYVIKPDDQQSEAENKINEFNAKADNEIIQEIEKTSKGSEKKIEHLPSQVGFTEDFLKRFDQRGLPDSNKMMKKFFLEAFKKAEEILGKKLVINSGIRTPEYQKLLTRRGYKTAKKSPHIEGVAADISIVNEDVNKIITALQEAGFNRFGVGKSFLHVDLGDQLNPKIWVPYARWSYTY